MSEKQAYTFTIVVEGLGSSPKEAFRDALKVMTHDYEAFDNSVEDWGLVKPLPSCRYCTTNVIQGLLCHEQGCPESRLAKQQGRFGEHQDELP